MRKMALIIGIVVVVLAGVALLAGFHARSGFAHGGGMFMDCVVDKFADRLELKADQRDLLMQMALEVKDRHQEMHSFRLAAREEMLGELRKEAIDKKKIRAVLDVPKTHEITHVISIGYPAEKSTIEDYEGSFKYWKDEDGNMHVPKRSLDDVIFKIIE